MKDAIQVFKERGVACNNYTSNYDELLKLAKLDKHQSKELKNVFNEYWIGTLLGYNVVRVVSKHKYGGAVHDCIFITAGQPDKNESV